MFNFFSNLFSSPVRRAVMKAISNSLRNQEIAYKSEVKNADERLADTKAKLLAEFHESIKAANADNKARKVEILNKRVADILAKVI